MKLFFRASILSFAIATLFPGIARAQFSDISGNPYEAEIKEAAAENIVSGFPDGTFRPDETVTREQAVSIIVDAISSVSPVDLKENPSRSVRNFLDVPTDRWSAEKIAWAQWNLFPRGSATGNFRPEDPIKRAEPVVFLRRSAGLLEIKLGKESPALTFNEDPIEFTDVAGYEEELTLQMSAYCRVASPINEEGDKFAPEKDATRDYTVDAIARTLNCAKADPK
ncbi:MAG: S-layer homology domain-containing protein [Cyanobacteria bacterium P01_H01_bin.15]